MKKVSVLLIACLIGLSGCFSTKLVAPLNTEVKLASEVEVLPNLVEKRIWFALWGLIPIGSNKTDKIITKYGFTKVKIEAKRDFLDYIISAIGGWVTINSSTIVVEGVNENQKK